MKSVRNREQLVADLKAKGIDVLFRQNDTGRIYGVTFIDHESRTVLNGSRLGKDFSANVFNDLFSGSRTLTGNSKQDVREYSPEEAIRTSRSDNFQSTGNAITGLFSLLSGGDDTPSDNDKFHHPKRRKRRRNKNVFSNP